MEIEYENYGFYAISHPLDHYKDYIYGKSVDVGQMIKMLQNNTWNPEWRVNLCAVKEEVKAITTKKGELMAFVTFSTYLDSIDAVMFPKTYNQAVADGLLEHNVFWITNIKAENRNGNIQIIIEPNNIKPLD